MSTVRQYKRNEKIKVGDLVRYYLYDDLVEIVVKIDLYDITTFCLSSNREDEINIILYRNPRRHGLVKIMP